MTTPFLPPYKKHIFVCTGRFCSPNRAGQGLYQLLPHLLARHGLLFGAERAKRGETPCLGVCEAGPIVVVYPDGSWYHKVTAAILEQIVADHLGRDRPVTAHLFFSLNNDEERDSAAEPSTQQETPH